MLEALVELACSGPPLRTAVVHPCDPASLTGALQAQARGLMQAVLVGPRARIVAAAEQAGLDLTGTELIDVPHSHAAADRAVELAREGRVAALMKGALHTQELMRAVVARESGLRTGRRMSHVFAVEVEHYPRILFITDGALNISPGLLHKRDIVQNAIDLAQAAGVEVPKVAILSASEEVDPAVASSLDAAALCKMGDRGQISGALMEGPLAMDNAVSPQAAATKGITSPVAGCADILLVPDLESGNMLVKQLVYLSGARTAGLVLGARVPIMLSSRADDVAARLAACALAPRLLQHRAR
ncbi:phosphotransacetylase [Tahibacter aquaticus]|uniref:Phosphotransacetylase n=1 Tax=Tahibacter aquaticus TaxID=520092 RepID=A0A4R6YTN7_9GAMM|nr:bifunctional enoyl-CoA hydratase/phosphate acetyltransferase [Tahibacter aquaticus]TDR41570.1 phosphotransacetylase [Tahibacter aquaticus]